MDVSDSTAALFTEVGLLIKSRMQRTISLPFSQCQTLWFVAEQKSPSMQDVARHFKIRAPSATFLVEELVRAGLLVRNANARDRRRVELSLTPKGRRSYKTIETKRNKILSTLFGSLDGSDRKELNRILEKIIKNS
jgi:MarR family transcriptional regulator, transcriptional regulator for hemolysin